MGPHTAPWQRKTELTDSGCIFHLQVPDDLYYLEGHFPQLPVVPGVCQLHWVVNAIAAYSGKTWHITAMEAVKFHRLLRPGQHFCMVISFDQGAGIWTYRLYTEGETLASGRLVVDT
jgi:3-hydroxymyristoyl/3-hydroxydecanoyl-(acyl carrier protein) dehydratase